MPSVVGEVAKGGIVVSDSHQFFLHTLAGRMILVALFLILSLLFASLVGWLPDLQ